MFAKIFGSLFALMGLAFLGYSLFLTSQEVLLAATGHPTTGTVTEKTTSYDQENNNNSYYFSYTYQDDKGQAHTSKSEVSKEMYAESVEGATILVVYSSAYPSTSRIRSAGVTLLPAGIIALLGGGAIWWGLRLLLRRLHWENKQARLITKGERRIGRLVALEEDKSEQAEDYIPLVLVYAFTDKTGQERTGKTFHVGPRDHDFWKARIGGPLDVRVNPADPTDHIALVEESKLLK